MSNTVKLLSELALQVNGTVLRLNHTDVAALHELTGSFLAQGAASAPTHAPLVEPAAHAARAPVSNKSAKRMTRKSIKVTVDKWHMIHKLMDGGASAVDVASVVGLSDGTVRSVYKGEIPLTAANPNS